MFVACHLFSLLVYLLAQGTPLVVESEATSAPSWSRPGCHKVGEFLCVSVYLYTLTKTIAIQLTNTFQLFNLPGHMREISIAGCVKFNLSTNACRGYCMSYSIPSTEEVLSNVNNDLLLDATGHHQIYHHHPQQQQHVGDQAKKSILLINRQPSALVLSAAQRHRPISSSLVTSVNRTTSASSSNNQNRNWEQQIGSYLDNSINADLRQRLLQQQQQALKSAVETGSGGLHNGEQTTSGELTRRDVVSVSQCCNMMETEDVSSNSLSVKG